MSNFFTDGYYGRADDDADAEEFLNNEAFIMTPFQCRKLFIKNAIDYLRGVIDDIKADIRDIKS